MLDYLPPHSGPLFWFLSRDPCMESPNQYLSQEPCFARNGCIGFEIQGSKLCSTIRPLTLGHCLGFFQGTHVWKAPISTFHQSLVLPGMVASVSRSKGPNCVRLFVPSLWATILVSFKGPMYGKPKPVPFTRALFCQEWLHQFRDPRVHTVLDYQPPHRGTTSRARDGSMNGCQKAVQLQLQFVSVVGSNVCRIKNIPSASMPYGHLLSAWVRINTYTPLSVLPLRLSLVRGLALGGRGRNEENQLPWPQIPPPLG